MLIPMIKETKGSAVPLTAGMRVRLLEPVGWIAVKGGVPAGALGTVRQGVYLIETADSGWPKIEILDRELADGVPVVWLVDFDKHKPKREDLVCRLDYFRTGGRLPAYLEPVVG